MSTLKTGIIHAGNVVSSNYQDRYHHTEENVRKIKHERNPFDCHCSFGCVLSKFRTHNGLDSKQVH